MAKMSARRKGSDFQRWITTWLTEKGWFVFNMPIGGRYQKKRDIFGCDIVAKHQKFNMTLWIQATAASRPGLKRKTEEMKKIPWKGGCDCVLLMIRRSKYIIDVMKLTINGNMRSLGKIIKRAWYSAEGINFEF